MNNIEDRQCQVHCQIKGHYFIASTDLRDGQASSASYQAAKDKITKRVAEHARNTLLLLRSHLKPKKSPYF